MSIEKYIRWKPEYDIAINIINAQHKGILDFLNNWYSEISSEADSISDVIRYMNTKYQFLAKFSKGHIGFEEAVLRILEKRYGFPSETLQHHISLHHSFIHKDLAYLYQYIRSISNDKRLDLLQDIPSNAVSDIAKWWYNHIRHPFSNEVNEPPDHTYRSFIRNMGEEEKIGLLNDIITYLGTNAKSKLAMIEAMDYFRETSLV